MASQHPEILDVRQDETTHGTLEAVSSDQARDVAAQRSVRIHRAILDSMDDLAFLKDAQGRYLAANRAAARVAGITPEEIIGKTDRDLFPPEIAEAFIADDLAISRGTTTIRRVERVVDVTSGTTRWLETIKNPVFNEDGSLLGVAGVARDITAQQEAEIDRRRLTDEVEQQHARLNDMIANVPGVVWEESFNGTFRYVNDYIEVMLGYTADEYLARFSSVLELMPHEDRVAYEATMASMAAEQRGGTHRFRLVRKDGQVIWCESHCSIIHGASGEPIGVRGVSMDVTERVTAEEALQQSEARFRHVADAAPVMIFSTDANGAAEFQNRRIAEFSGNSDLTGAKWLSIVHPDDLERARDSIARAHETHVFVPFEMRARRNDGQYRDLFVAAAVQRAPDGSFGGFVGTCVDLTEPRHLERRLEDNKRMASLGRLAATIAHEINNVLMAIQPFSEIIRRGPSPAVLSRAADRIASAVQRGGRITHQILRYAHASEPSVRAVNVRSWLSANGDEWQALLGSRVELKMDAPKDLCVLADPHQLQQIFVNLATNASEAMHGNGALVISARQTRRWAGLDDKTGLGFVHFVIDDTGPGISDEIAARIFEPLFTTRPSGTGLGLAIVHDVVRKHGGLISAEGDRAGARFHLVLPAAACDGVASVDSPEAWPQSIRRVLIVEDEEAVADALTLLLEMDGLVVKVVDRGSEATAAIAAFDPDLVILDVGLPDMPGTVVFEHIRREHPTLPVLFSTGHAPELEHEMTRLSGPVGHVLKPFDAATLIAAVRALR
jgi:PAS domain S-box-containing protein